MNWRFIDGKYHDTFGEYTIKNLNPSQRKKGWELSCREGIIGKFDTLRDAKVTAEVIENSYNNIQKPRAILKAFNGTVIGEFDIAYENDKIVAIKTKHGNLRFDKVTGVQANTKKTVFYNRIEIL